MKTLLGDGTPEGFEPERISVGTHVDTADLGVLVAVNTNRANRRCKARVHEEAFECVFDTGIVMYVPPALFDTMVFQLEEKDP